MTEKEWLAGENTPEMVGLLAGKQVNDRKFRLFACASFDTFASDEWGIDPPAEARRIVEVSRRFADGNATEKERLRALRSANKGIRTSGNQSLICVAWRAAHYALHRVPWVTAHNAFSTPHNLMCAAPSRKQKITLARANESAVALFREVFGNPFRPVTVSAEWRTETAVALARQMYDSRDFSAMPILADALQDAGCDSAEILDHCRGPGPHVRGCFVVDLVLGKS
jgi:hypothetical protein